MAEPFNVLQSKQIRRTTSTNHKLKGLQLLQDASQTFADGSNGPGLQLALQHFFRYQRFPQRGSERWGAERKQKYLMFVIS